MWAADRPNDFIYYWTAAKLVLAGKNPYSLGEAMYFHSQLPFPAGTGRLVMLNPPWTLPLVAPFGLVSFSTGKICWLLLGLALTFISVHWLWDLYGAGENRLIGWLVAATFLPVASVLGYGQIGPLILFGLAGFLRFEAIQHEYAAGALLFLAAVKPHLVFLLWIALSLCAVFQRRWKPLAAFLAMLAIASFLAVLLDPRVFNQYVGVLGAEKGAFESPALGGLLRRVSGFPAMQFLPIGVAALWFGFYWIRWHASWVWRDRLPTLLLVSMAATPYAYFFDQAVLLPSMLYATGIALRSRRSVLLVAVLLYFIINGSVQFLLIHHQSPFSYSWTALAWLILFSYVRHGSSGNALQSR